jgi:hypothetical protein
MSLSTMRHININHALHSPSKEQLTTLLSILCSDGRLWKFGSCFVDQLDTRPFSKVHYNPTWFDTKDAMCVAHGITTKELAAVLETAGIQHLKYTLHVGVNVKDHDDVPHDHISAARPQASCPSCAQSRRRRTSRPIISPSTSSRTSACRL